MKLESLADHLKHYSARLTTGNPDCAEVCDVEIFSHGLEVYDPAVVYILLENDLSRVNWQGGAKNFISLVISDTQEIKRLPEAVNVITIGERLALETLFKEVQTIFADNWILESAASRLYELLFQEAGLQQIMDVGAAYIHSPLFLISADRTPIAYTHGIRATGDLQSLAFKLKISKLDFRKRGAGAAGVRTTDADGVAWVAGKIVDGGRIIAYMLASERENTLQGDDLRLFDVLNKVVALELKKAQYEHYFTGKTDEQLVYELIQGNLHADNLASEILQKHGWNLKENLYLLTISSPNRSLIPLLKRKIGLLIPGCKFAVFNGNLLVIFNRDPMHPMLHNEIAEIRLVLKTSGVYGGLSRQFSTLTEIKRFYHQTINTIEIGQHLEPEKSLFEYDHYVFDIMLGICSTEEDLIHFCHPDLLALVEYDKKNKTFFVDTVRAYIKHNGNYKATAQELHIQLSTLTYRMKKIRELMHRDLDENSFFQAELSIKVFEYLKKI